MRRPLLVTMPPVYTNRAYLLYARLLDAVSSFSVTGRALCASSIATVS